MIAAITPPDHWLPETVSFSQIKRILADRHVFSPCEACTQQDRGWTLLAESEDGRAIELTIGGHAFFAMICRHCGHTRLHHKRTLFLAINGLLEAAP